MRRTKRKSLTPSVKFSFSQDIFASNDVEPPQNGLFLKPWGDEAFKQELLANPVAVLQKNGIDAAKPDVELSELEMGQVAGLGCFTMKLVHNLVA